MAALENNSSIQNLSFRDLSTNSSHGDPCKNSALFSTSAVSIAIVSCYALLIPLTVLGNGSVIAAFVSNTRLRTTTNIFIVGLAASDILVGTFALPFWTFIVSHENIMAGYCFSTYTVYISFDVFAGCASILQLTAIAIERFFSMKWPLIHRKMPQWVYCIILTLAWLCATVMAVLQPLQVRTELWRQAYTAALFAFCFFFPFVIIVSCYCYIFKVTRFQARRRLSSCSDSQRCGTTPGVAIKELNVAITVAVITGLFLAAWLPFFSVTVIATFCMTCLPSGAALLHLVKFFKFLQYSSSAINPYIYAYRNREMRATLAKIAGKIFPCDLARSWTRNLSSKRHAKHPLKQSATENVQANGLNRCNSCSENNNSFKRAKNVLDEKIKVRQKKRNKKKTVVIYV